MVAISKAVAPAARGVDLEIGFTYVPPVGEGLDGLTITAKLAGHRLEYPADRVEFDAVTGRVLAIWQEETTRRLISGASLDALFVRERGGATRLLYVRPVTVR